MSKIKTPEEMNILIDKLNKEEITWDDVPQELERIRKQAVRPAIKSNNPLLNTNKSVK